MPHPLRRSIRIAAPLLLAASPLAAQIEDHLSAYTGPNAKGYLDPLASAIGTSLNAGLFRDARVPESGFHLFFEFPIVGLYFSDDDETFDAVTEEGFSPRQTVRASTVVGPTEAVIVDGDGGTHFAFPGGFDIGSFAILAPQLRIGSVFGTEAMIRFFAAKIENSELGDVMLTGFGARHSVSQHFPEDPPFDLSASFFWQQFKLGENENGADLTKTSTWSFGVQASRSFDMLTPYTGLYYNSYALDVSYESEAGGDAETIELGFEDDCVQWTIGMDFNISIIDLFAEYNVAGRSSLAFGFGMGF